MGMGTQAGFNGQQACGCAVRCYSTTRSGESGDSSQNSNEVQKTKGAEEIFPTQGFGDNILASFYDRSKFGYLNGCPRVWEKGQLEICASGLAPGAADGAAGRSASSQPVGSRVHCHWPGQCVAQLPLQPGRPWVNVSPRSGRSGHRKLEISDTTYNAKGAHSHPLFCMLPEHLIHPYSESDSRFRQHTT